MIGVFRDRYFYLDNYYPCKIEYLGVEYQNAEAAYQAQKCPERQAEFEFLPAEEAFKLGRAVPLRPNWDLVKNLVMRRVVRAKFTQNLALRQALVATGDETIINTNYYGDRYWGVYKGTGENRLGDILMKTREELVGGKLPLHERQRRYP